jgi:4-carboxymuconolactone decarboxylase
MDDTERAAQGMAVRREVLGDAHVDRAVAGTTAFTGDFQDFITRYAWGAVNRAFAVAQQVLAEAG